MDGLWCTLDAVLMKIHTCDDEILGWLNFKNLLIVKWHFLLVKKSSIDKLWHLIYLFKWSFFNLCCIAVGKLTVRLFVAERTWDKEVKGSGKLAVIVHWDSSTVALPVRCQCHAVISVLMPLLPSGNKTITLKVFFVSKVYTLVDHFSSIIL